ncbi:hypothetical protein P4I81_08765 [Bacillus cereus]|uniref:Uncharacterized protein n=1 Tax=Bacillus paranthracis TaxID=2026186 RepID=A0AAX3QHC2_9BACI|nr:MULTISPECIES: hypothetical protein [Bacillus cereus group]OUB93087.1 hypothetical protein BK752_27385 [Bacillus thuringiensis serovar canadensis]PGT35614.1 hypothetical protein COC97_24360 [Bacillus anthracis]EXY06181.1 hypothetical protein BF15_24670 [Bacillus thuringiensis]MBE5114191.1 hypothetical protein [Bacillus paranthracis]MEB8632243.1 hypothetical protein [Bacillus cereus]
MAAKKATETTVYKVIAPKPFTYVATNYFGGLWADEKGVFVTEDKATYEYLLTFAEFKDITGI